MNSIAFYLFGIPVHFYGLIISSAIALGVIIAMYFAKTRGFDTEIILDFVILAVPLAIICARLYYVVFTWDIYKDNPLTIFMTWKGGLAIYGGVIGGVIAAIIFCKRRKINVFDILDICAPSLILGQALGRWGNFFNQEAYGYIVTDKNLQWFPYAVFIERTQTWQMATFFYESAWDMAVFVFLFFYSRKLPKKGNVFLLYLLLYGLGRSVIEGLRTDSLWLIPNVIRVSQMLSIVLVVFSAIVLIYRNRKSKNILDNNSLK